MKTMIRFSPLFCFFVFVMLQTGVTSCTKDQTIYDTVVKIDTLVIKDTTISLQLLTANPWKMQEIRGVTGNDIIFYQRGGASNTENYDNEYIIFNTDKTGTLHDAAGATHQITWEFSNNTNTKITFVVQNPAPLDSQTVVYENLRYKNKALLFDQYWTYGDLNSHTQVIRLPSSY